MIIINLYLNYRLSLKKLKGALYDCFKMLFKLNVLLKNNLHIRHREKHEFIQINLKNKKTALMVFCLYNKKNFI